MKRLHKILIVVGVLLLLAYFVRVHVSFNWAKTDQHSGLSFCTSTSWSSNDRVLRTAGKIGIVCAPVGNELKPFQREVAEKLCEQLSEQEIACRATVSGTTRRCPKVSVYPRRIEAARKGMHYVILVQPKAWNYSANPFSRRWSAAVAFKGGATDSLISDPPCWSDSPYAWYTFEAEYDGGGTTRGLFSTSYLTSSVAEDIAEELARKLSSSIIERLDDTIRDIHSDNPIAGKTQSN